ncbi:unnamed protein product, partial [Ectocarpus sp. 8 AP-2014]
PYRRYTGHRTTRALWRSYPLEIVVGGWSSGGGLRRLETSVQQAGGHLLRALRTRCVVVRRGATTTLGSTGNQAGGGQLSLSLKSSKLWVFPGAISRQTRGGSEAAAAPLAAQRQGIIIVASWHPA